MKINITTILLTAFIAIGAISLTNRNLSSAPQQMGLNGLGDIPNYFLTTQPFKTGTDGVIVEAPLGRKVWVTEIGLGDYYLSNYFLIHRDANGVNIKIQKGLGGGQLGNSNAYSYDNIKFESNCFVLEPGEELYLGDANYQPACPPAMSGVDGYWSGYMRP